MYQQEIQFFWPLTEQIPLDLDFTPCQEYKNSLVLNMGTLSAGTGLTFTAATQSWSPVSISGSQLNLDVETIEFKLNATPNPVRRLLYKLIGLKWKVK